MPEPSPMVKPSDLTRTERKRLFREPFRAMIDGGYLLRRDDGSTVRVIYA